MSILRIPQPCAKSWAAMTPADAGRHCAACAKTVVDFTHKTDAEILAYLARAAGGQACGRFRAGQLGRPLPPPAAPTRWRAWLGAFLATGSLLGSGRASAQSTAQHAPGGPVPMAIYPPAPGSAAAPAAPAVPGAAAFPGSHELLTLHGVVLDARNTPLPGVTVQLKSTTQATYTESDGSFELQLTNAEPSPLLVVSFVGFMTHEQPITIGAAGLVAPVQVTLEYQVTGELQVSRPYPWHPRAFFNWSKYWLTRPFHR